MANSFSKLINSNMWKKPITLRQILLILLLLSIFVLYIVNSASSIYFPTSIKINNKPKINFSGITPLAHGLQSYEVLTNSSKSFKIIQVDIDPLDVKKGRVQIVTVKVEDTKNNPITKANKVEATVYQDNTSVQFSFVLKKTEGLASSTITTWQGSWEQEDSHDFKYTMTITAKTAGDSHSINLSFR